MKYLSIACMFTLLYIAATLLLYASVNSVQDETLKTVKVAYTMQTDKPIRCDHYTLLNVNKGCKP